MKNLKIGTKLLITFMLIVILFCATVATAIWGLSKNAEKYSDFYNVGYQITNKVMNMRRGMQVIAKDLAFVTIDSDSQSRDTYLEDIQKEVDLLETNSAWLAENFTGDSELVGKFTENVSRVEELQQQVVDAAHTDMNQAQEMVLGEYQPLLQEAVDVLIQISQSAEKDAEADYENTVDLQKELVALQLGMAGAALVITLVISTYLTRSITKPLKELERSAGKIVDGDFDIQITYQSKDEMGRLANAFRNMTEILEAVITDASRLLGDMADGNFAVRTEAEERYVGSFQSLLMSMRKLNRNLSSTLSQINQSADLVASESGQVSNGAQALSQGSTQQAAAVQELAATITDISHQVKDTADNAVEARSQSGAAGDEMEECNQQMQEMMEAMEEISRTSNEIGKIIKTIEDIAFQTNILALNAAVEASRAGSAGKGFAVVADEVRNLASKSSDASKDTAELIESSIKAVERGTQLADSTAESLVKVVEEVRSVASTVGAIADAAEKQAGAIEQVTLGVDQISDVVQTNSSTAVQSASASQELSGQAEMLKELVAKFVLQEDAAYSGSGERQGYPSIEL